MYQVKTTLYALNKDGSYQQWKVFTDGAKVIVEFGKLGGKLQQKETICTPKNVGRSNETTADKQAELEAISKWEKQVRLGYRKNIEDLDALEVSPMLATDASKKPNMIKYPCHIQPKYDGLRVLVKFSENGPKFISRGNKEYNPKGNVVDELNATHHAFGYNEFDGEFYIHGLPLQKIVSLVKKWRSLEDIEKEIEKDFQSDIKRRDKAIQNGEKTWKDFNKVVHHIDEPPVRDSDRYCGYCSYDLKMMVFDIPSRFEWVYRADDLKALDAFFSVQNFSNLEAVSFKTAHNEDEVKTSIGEYMQQGFEGTIIRNLHGSYEYCQRSGDLLKWKVFQDTEAKVIDVEKDKNGEGVLICEEKDGTQFRCKLKGTFADRNYEKCLSYVGKFITVKFQQRTVDGVVQFPVGICIRSVNEDTWEPTE